MKRSLDEDAVRAILPHRDVMLLCHTAVVDGEGGATAELCVDGNSWAEGLSCPHLYLLEGLAQLSGLALAGTQLESNTGPGIGYLAEATGLEFFGAVVSGMTISLSTTREISFGGLHRFRVAAEFGSEVIVRGCLTVATA